MNFKISLTCPYDKKYTSYPTKWDGLNILDFVRSKGYSDCKISDIKLREFVSVGFILILQDEDELVARKSGHFIDISEIEIELPNKIFSQFLFPTVRKVDDKYIVEFNFDKVKFFKWWENNGFKLEYFD